MRSTEYHSVWEQRKTEEKRRRDLAIRKAKGVAKVLKKKYHAKEVILFGSLIWRPEFFWRGTDIDLMVKGIDDQRYFEILADISSVAHPFHVDLIPYEKARPLIKERARKEGVGLE